MSQHVLVFSIERSFRGPSLLYRYVELRDNNSNTYVWWFKN